jgi:hypothetical protein
MPGTSWLLSSLPQNNGKLLLSLDYALILKMRVMTMGSSAPFSIEIMGIIINMVAKVNINHSGSRISHRQPKIKVIKKGNIF